MAEGTWLRDKAAFVGFGHTRYGTRGELGINGPVPMVVEAVVKACEDAGISPADITILNASSGVIASSTRSLVGTKK